MILEKEYIPCVLDNEDCLGQITWDRVLLTYTCDAHRILEGCND